MDDVTLQAILKLKDEMSAPLREVNRILKDTEAVAKTSKKTMKEYSTALKDMGKMATVAGGAIVASLGSAFVYSAKQAIEFESAFTGVKLCPVI